MRLQGIFLTLAFGLVLAQAQTADREALWGEVADAEKKGPVSYTHLTLPTIYSV